MKTNLQSCRKAAGFKSANAFADYMGISRATYRNYEQGISPITLEKACEFADVLNVSLDDLAGREPPNIDKAEERLLTSYRELSTRQQAGIIEIVESIVEVELKSGPRQLMNLNNGDRRNNEKEKGKKHMGEYTTTR